jgi:alkylation response protein AidB-like acyl-CoA dehydrogenase
MRLADNAAEVRFRAEVRAWLGAHLNDALRSRIRGAIHAGDSRPSRQWHAMLHRAGFAARSWPGRYGGRDGTLGEDMILFEELAATDAPNDIFRVGVRIIGPMIMKLAREEQKLQLLPGTADGTILWSQAFSEPSAGSDVASLKMRAVSAADGFVINGQKVWNTFGHMADYTLLLARTNAGVAKHQGLTTFAVRLDTPGITIRPIPQMSGRSDFNEIFFEDVKVPRSAVIGQVDGGWQVAVTMLDFERRGMAAAGFECGANFRRLVRLAASLRRTDGTHPIEDASVRTKLSELGIQAQIAVLNNHRFAAMVREGEAPGAEASVQKLHSTELNKALYGMALELIMNADLANPEQRRLLPQASEDYLGSFGFTIGGGTAQIQRNIIAERVLGLPR